ncbi:pseudaminic acid cytidylyltransferase [Aliiglaciecola sp. M165]|uniref:pseudaminic acid cytidylyltransferase n=1 Tax=Aliiglaciecola sp. M165 TaxID=2593649 RepID=UPI00117F71A8|nr:pseudaminic acid cytidylyltransferase [Aliiglaciecola sp. M165]TRY30930.1 pseudaminic acid cytidylyltransferase [Aliiglaciecola sp. M165]
MNLAIIPARGGSKRIPAKNIKEFAGKPLIAYSIQAAQKSGLFEEIWVSTDSEQVAEIAKQFGAKVPYIRPAELSNDLIGTRPVTSHAIKHCIDNLGKPEFCCCIYATAPFLQAEYLKKGLEVLKHDAEKSFSFAVTSYAFPIQRSISIQAGRVTPMFPENIFKRSQDLEEAYHDAGQFYWGKTDDYLSNKGIFSQHSVPVVLPRHLVQDIDTPEDWHRAELMYQAYVRGMQSE